MTLNITDVDDPSIDTTIAGAFTNSRFGLAVDILGDFNGDGIADIAGGGPNLTTTGTAYVHITYGDTDGLPEDIDPLKKPAGQYIIGDFGAGYIVTDAGDFNGDGFTDLLVGEDADYHTVNDGSREPSRAYIVYGKAPDRTDTLAKHIKLNSLTPDKGFAITSDAGFVSAGAGGDFNGDGLDDLIFLGRNEDLSKLDTYIVYGTDDPITQNIGIDDIDGTNGVVLENSNIRALVDNHVGDSFVGDLNGDGLDDIVLGTALPVNLGIDDVAYVIYGTDSGAASIDVASLDGSNGYAVVSDPAVTGYLYDYAGQKTAELGDINKDGFDDFAISTFGLSGSQNVVAVVYGSATNVISEVALEDLNGDNGFLLTGLNLNDAFGMRGVASAGDVNGDGIDDFVVGAPTASPQGLNVAPYAGQAYIIYGQEGGFGPSFSVSDLNGTNGFSLDGANAVDLFGSDVAGGDVNGDGFSDIAIGAMGADPLGRDNAGEVHIAYGGNFTGSVDVLGTSGDDDLTGTAQDDVMNGAQGNDTITGGLGDDILTGASGDDTFVFSTGDGNDEIRDFNPHYDRLDLTGMGFDSIGDVADTLVQVPGGLLMDFGGGDSILLTNVTENSWETFDILI